MNYKAILSDHILFDAFKRGDQRAFMEVYHGFKRAIYATTIKMVRSAEEAEDLTVQVFVRAWERRETIYSMAHLKNLLFISARNAAIDSLQAKKCSQVELSAEVTEEIDSYNISKYETDQLFTNLVEDIMAVIKTMPKVRATVFRMRYLEDRSVQEVSETLHLSAQSVYSHTKEALAQAREALLLKKGQIRSKVYFLLIFFTGAALIRVIFQKV
jgi:RNA polymerase sigma factor (sigma-70 family)